MGWWNTTKIATNKGLRWYGHQLRRPFRSAGNALRSRANKWDLSDEQRAFALKMSQGLRKTGAWMGRHPLATTAFGGMAVDALWD